MSGFDSLLSMRKVNAGEMFIVVERLFSASVKSVSGTRSYRKQFVATLMHLLRRASNKSQCF